MAELRDRLAALAAEPRRPLDLDEVRRRGRQRRRRRRSAAGGAALTAAAVIAAAAVALAGGAPTPVVTTSPPSPTSSVPASTGPTGATTSPPSTAAGAGAGAGRVIPRGKYVPSTPLFPTPGQGILGMGGSSLVGSEKSYFWSETTSDGGATWRPSGLTTTGGSAAAATPVGFVDHLDGWALNGFDGLWVTHDGGTSWDQQSKLPFTDYTPAGSSAWFVSMPAGCTAHCHAKIYTTAHPGAPLEPLAMQPPGLSQLVALTRPSTTAAAVLVVTGQGGALETTTDAGRTWSNHSLPCPAQTVDGYDQLASAPGGALWLTCQAFTGSTDARNGATTVYRSSDLGRSWQRATPAHPNRATTLDGPDHLEVVTPTTAWATVTGQLSQTTTVYRTVDGGATWTAVYRSNGPMYDVSLNATSPNQAWIAAVFGAYHDRVLHTTDAGQHWTLANLPLPTTTSPANPHTPPS